MGQRTRTFRLAEMTPEQRANLDAFLATSLPDQVDPADCTREHPDIAGPNMDIGQCSACWMPMGVMRPEGESFGWHLADCSLPVRHPGYCAPGGPGHVMPPGEKIRG